MSLVITFAFLSHVLFWYFKSLFFRNPYKWFYLICIAILNVLYCPGHHYVRRTPQYIMSDEPHSDNLPVLKGNLNHLSNLDMCYSFCFAVCTAGLGCLSSSKDHVSFVTHITRSEYLTQMASWFYRDQPFCT